MKNLKDIIQEVLVHKHANKDTDKGYTFIDLGLPSGTLWCDKNVGAKNIYDIGDYYRWGETEKMTSIQKRETYKFSNGINYTNYTKYNMNDKKIDLENSDDIASIIVKENSHMPTIDQAEELIENTIIDYVFNDHKAYVEFKSKTNNNSIIIPYGGFYNAVCNPNQKLYCMRIWTKTVNEADETDAWALGHNNKKHYAVDVHECSRVLGYNVRAVKDKYEKFKR